MTGMSVEARTDGTARGDSDRGSADRPVALTSAATLVDLTQSRNERARASHSVFAAQSDHHDVASHNDDATAASYYNDHLVSPLRCICGTVIGTWVVNYFCPHHGSFFG